jgi:hypothetical protein
MGKHMPDRIFVMHCNPGTTPFPNDLPPYPASPTPPRPAATEDLMLLPLSGSSSESLLVTANPRRLQHSIDAQAASGLQPAAVADTCPPAPNLNRQDRK